MDQVDVTVLLLKLSNERCCSANDKSFSRRNRPSKTKTKK